MSFEKYLFAMSLLSACTGLGTTGQASDTLGADSADDTEMAEAVDSSYALSSVFSITSASLAPEPAYQLLSDLNDNPGQALVSLAEAAGVPAADLLFAALPNSLSGKVEQWMSAAIGSSAELQVLMTWSQLLLAEIEVQSELQIGDFNEEGYAEAQHILGSFVFHVEDQLVEEDIPQIDSLPGAGHASLSVQSQRTDDGLYLHFGEQRFGLLVGEAAYRAFQSLIEARYGTDLRGVLGASIDCASMASEVAARCVLGVCVGHQSELVALCNGALDSAVEQVHAQFAVLDAEVLRLESGSAQVLASESGSQLIGGEWQAQAELGQGLRTVPARFTGDSL